MNDLMAKGGLALQSSLTVKELTETIHAHPTLPEVVVEAAGVVAFGEAIQFNKMGRRR